MTEKIRRASGEIHQYLVIEFRMSTGEEDKNISSGNGDNLTGRDTHFRGDFNVLRTSRDWGAVIAQWSRVSSRRGERNAGEVHSRRLKLDNLFSFCQHRHSAAPDERYSTSLREVQRHAAGPISPSGANLLEIGFRSLTYIRLTFAISSSPLH